jgi:predicted transcriptional regulator
MMTSDGRVGDLVRVAVERRDALAAFGDDRLAQRDLTDRLDVSRSTAHRIVGSFEELGLVRRIDDDYELTALGGTVAEHVARFEREIRAAAGLAPVLDAAESGRPDVDPSLFADAEITTPSPTAPYRVLDRLMTLAASSSAVRMLDTVVMDAAHVEKLARSALDDTRVELLYPPPVAEGVVRAAPEAVDAAVRQGDLFVGVAESIPFRLVLFDDRVGLCGNDPDSGMPSAFVDTDDPAAYAWGEDVYESFRREATPAPAVHRSGSGRGTDADPASTPDPDRDRSRNPDADADADADDRRDPGRELPSI